MQSSKGVTLIELLLVIAIVLILGASTTPFLSSFVGRNNFDTSTDMLISFLRKSQNYAMDNKNGELWGVCMDGSTLKLYSVSCSSPNISEEYEIPRSVTIVGLDDINFSSRGEPNNTVSILLSSVSDSINLQINSAGGMDIN